jgi:internalin A
MPLVLHEAEGEKIINSADYPAETHRFMLDLMRAFQLSYASEEEKGKPARCLVPELLPEFEPDMLESWESAPVRLRYHYGLLPPGLLPRFIVRTHALLMVTTKRAVCRWGWCVGSWRRCMPK